MDTKVIQEHIADVIGETHFEGLGEKYQGKVRDVYKQKNRLIFVATDRYSAFDRNLALIPFKGQVLTGVSAFWFNETKDIIENHMIAIPDPNVMIVTKCEMVPIEVIVRGYITGVTGTSIWILYQKGERTFGGLTLPEGMKKNQKLERPIITPTTKMEAHDRPLTVEEIVSQGFANKEIWEKIEEAAIALFLRGEKIAKERGLILVDTKYEFGVAPSGKLMLIDEIHTPDSSRYWQAGAYEERIAQGQEPENFDKEFLRLWFKEHSDPYKDEKLPDPPQDMIVELSSRYIKIFEQITGKKFKVDFSKPALERIERNLASYYV